MARPIFSYFPQSTPTSTPYPVQDVLMGLGIGLLGNRNFGQGAAQGLQYANELAGQRRAERRQDESDAREAARFGFEQQQAEQKQRDAEARRTGILGMFSPQPAAPTGGPQGMFMGGLQAGQGSQQAAPMPMPQAQTGNPDLAKYFQPEELGMLQKLAQFDPDQAEQIVQQRIFAQPKDNSTNDQLEYKQAVGQGFKGTLLDFILAQKKAGAPTTSTTINNKDYGNIPPGYRLVESPNGVSMEAVPGSPADQAVTNRKKGAAQTADIVTDDINRALQGMDQAILPTTGLTGGVLSNIPNTASYNVAGLVKTIKGNVGIDKLQQMRLQSPTGGALGNVTETENATLQSLLGNLDQSQDDEQFRYNLKRVYNKYLDIVHGEGKGPARYDLGPAAPGPDQTQQKRVKVDALGNIINGD
jgi:hypothetical protein